MVYRKRYNKSRRPYYRRNVVSRVARVGMKSVHRGGMAYRALRLAKRLADAVNTEHKAVDGAATFTPDWNGNIGSIPQIAVGTADNQRIGDSCKLQNLTLRFTVGRGAADSICRVMMLHDPQNKISTVSDVLTQVGNIYGVLSPKNYDKRFQCKVLLDKTFVLTTDSPLHRWNHVIPLNFHTQFNAGTTTINTGDLKYLYISNQSTNVPSLAVANRLTFTDN